MDDVERHEPGSGAGQGRQHTAELISGMAALISIGAALLVNLITDFRPPDWLGNADTWASVAGVLVGMLALVVTVLVGLRPGARSRHGAGPATSTMESRIDEASRSLQVTATLVDELQAEMQARVAALDRLRAENDEFEKLAAVRKEEAAAVSRLIENVISSTHARLSRSSRRDQVLFFLAGLAASIPVQIAVAWLT